MAAGARKDVVWDAGAGRDPRREALDIEAAIATHSPATPGCAITESWFRPGLTAWSL
jgi:hypothetical protein